MKSKLPYVLAVIFGIAIPAIAGIPPFPIILALVCFFGAALLGYFWPKESWRWGLWIVGPVMFLLLLSILFAGQWDIFLQKDLPVLLVALTATCLGSFLFAWLKQKQTKTIQK